MLIDSYAMQARKTPAQQLAEIPACKAWFRMTEVLVGEPSPINDSVSGMYYKQDFWATGVFPLTDESDYSILIEDNRIAEEDLFGTRPDFGTNGVIMIFAGKAYNTANMRCTIGNSGEVGGGSVGFSFVTNMHVAVRGEDDVFGLSYFPATAAPTTTEIPVGTEIIGILKYFPSGVADGKCSVHLVDENLNYFQNASAEDSYSEIDTPVAVGAVQIGNMARMHGCRFRSACWFSVSQIPDDLFFAAQWMAAEWKKGNKVLFPGCAAWT